MPPSQKVLQRPTYQPTRPQRCTRCPLKAILCAARNPWYQAFISDAAPTLTAAYRTVVAPHDHQETGATVPL